MSRTLTNLKAHEHTSDLPGDARRHRRRVEIRRVAAIRPEGAHFKLRPIRGSLQAAQR
jgi:hypothetical protein